MAIVYLILLLGACVCFGIAAFATLRGPWGNVRFVALGLLLFVAVATIQMLVRIA